MPEFRRFEPAAVLAENHEYMVLRVLASDATETSSEFVEWGREIAASIGLGRRTRAVRVIHAVRNEYVMVVAFDL